MNGLYYISSSGSRFPAAFSIAFKSSGSEFSSGGREVVALSPDGSVVMASCMAATIPDAVRSWLPVRLLSALVARRLSALLSQPRSG